MSLILQKLISSHSKQLQAALALDFSTARIEVQCLLQAVLQVSRAYLIAHPERVLGDDEAARYLELFERRLHGEPVAYLLGEREFYGLSFKVTPATLIPRHETELLVELALQRMPHRSAQFSPASGRAGKYRVLDLGTGSGAIALSIAHACPHAEVVAVDASTAALEVAQFNAQRLALSNVRLLLSDWFSALHGESFDVIVANPPYIAADDAHLTSGDVRFEPVSALASGADGLADIRQIITRAMQFLNARGWLMLEHGYDQADRVREIMRRAGFQQVFSACDLAGIERVTGGQAA